VVETILSDCLWAPEESERFRADVSEAVKSTKYAMAVENVGTTKRAGFFLTRHLSLVTFSSLFPFYKHIAGCGVMLKCGG
jgi:hypothetical protein